MADLLKRELDVVAQINSLKSTDVLYSILIGTTNTRLDNLKNVYANNFINVAYQIENNK